MLPSVICAKKSESRFHNVKQKTFTTVGFQNCKKKPEGFKEHKKSDGHLQAIHRLLSQQNQQVSVLLMLYDKEKIKK